MPLGGHEEEESRHRLLSGQLKMSAVAHPFSYPTSTPTILSGHILYILSKEDIQMAKRQKKRRIYMEFRKMVMITLCARQQKRHRCREQSFGLCGRGQGWDDLEEWH